MPCLVPFPAPLKFRKKLSHAKSNRRSAAMIEGTAGSLRAVMTALRAMIAVARRVVPRRTADSPLRSKKSWWHPLPA